MPAIRTVTTRLSSSFAALLAAAAIVLGCGGAKPEAAEPSTAAPPPVPVATAMAEAEPEPPRIRVDFLEAKMSPLLDKPVVVRLDAPAPEGFVPAVNAPGYRIRFAVAGAKLPEGAYVQLVLDNEPFRPVTDLKEKLTLADLVGEGREIAEGEHILAVYVAQPNHEAVRSERGVAVSRFWVGKRSPGTFKSRDPLLVMGSPSGTYEGEKAQEIIVDFYLVNATLSDKEYSVKMLLHGPGAEGKGLQRLVTDWRPQLVLLAEGDYTLEATLLDPQGQPVESPWNPAKRSFTAKP